MRIALVTLGVYALVVIGLLVLIARANRDPVYDDQMRPVDPTKPTPTPGAPTSTADDHICPVCGFDCTAFDEEELPPEGPPL